MSKAKQQRQQQDHGKDKEDKGKIITINEFEIKTILEETEKSEASELDKKESAEATNQVFQQSRLDSQIASNYLRFHLGVSCSVSKVSVSTFSMLNAEARGL